MTIHFGSSEHGKSRGIEIINMEEKMIIDPHGPLAKKVLSAEKQSPDQWTDELMRVFSQAYGGAPEDEDGFANMPEGLSF